MPIYISSKNEQIDTSTMPQPYLERALNKAQEEGNQENIDALSAEMQIRSAEEETAPDPLFGDE